jgi:FkbM family methyltransferase
MKTLFRGALHAGLRALGLSAVRTRQTYEANRAAVFRKAGIDLVIDVGANAGQYATSLRNAGFRGWIYSFEPLPDAFQQLTQSRKKDNRWRGRNIALGSRSDVARFHVSADSVCSSLRAPTAALISAIPSAATVGDIQVKVAMLDDESLPDFTRAALKLDVQGSEKEVLAGARALLPKVDILEIELSLLPTYEDAYGFSEAFRELEAIGFELVSLGRGASDTSTGRLLDADMLFQRREPVESALSTSG